MVAEAVAINTPFNNPITGFCAFTHKAGIHAKAILNNPSTYEILDPSDFGMTRYVHFASRLTGWNAVKTRVAQLGLTMTDEQVKTVYVLPQKHSHYPRNGQLMCCSYPQDC
jgi:homocitrate synthase